VSNALRCGTFSLATSNLGVNLWVGNNPDWVATTAIRPGWRWDLLMSEPARHGVLSPVDASGWLRDRALAWAASDPLGWLGGLAVKLADTFNGLEVPRNLDPYGDLGRTPLTAALLWDHGLRLPFGLVLPLAVAGLAAWWRMGGDQARAARTFAAFALLDALGIALFFPTGRYRLGLALALLVPAASGAVAVADRLRGRGALPWAGLAAAAVAGLAVNAMPALTGPDLHDEGPIQLALAYESAGRHADARDLLVDEVRRRPDDADAWRLLGQAIAATGDEEGAIAPLRRAVGLAPDFAHAWQHLGGILLNRGRARDAVPPLEKAVEANPGHPLAWVDLASARLRVKDYAGGLAAAREAVRVNPDHPEAWLHLGHALLLTGDPGGAEGPLRRAAAMAPRDPSPRYLLARSLADRARTDEAIAALRDVLARWPGHAASRKLLDRLTGASPAAGS
jgi:cytochrome c-type biogenesis protein CcmH/NrfG